MEKVTCTNCNGTGYIEECLDDEESGSCSREECQICNGTGYEIIPE